MEKSNFTLILTQDDGTFATPDIEITENFETAFSIQSVADIGERKDNLSKNISFPDTRNNRRIFNSLYSFNRNSNSNLTDTLFYNYSPNISVRCVLLENGYPSIAGSLKINDIKKDKTTKAFTLTGIITGRIVSFFGKISDLLLSDLDGFDEEFIYSWENIRSSWGFDPSDRFLYPMIDYGNGLVPNPNTFDLRNIRPAFYAVPLIKQILASQGYKLKSDSLNSDLFNRLFIPFQEVGFGKTTYGNFFQMDTLTPISYFLNRPRFVVRSSFGSARYTDLPANDFLNIQRDVNVMQVTDGSNNFTTTADIFNFTRPISTEIKMVISFTLKAAKSQGNGIVAIQRIVGGQFNADNSALARFTHDFSDGKIWAGEFTLTIPYQLFETGFTFGLFVSGIRSGDIIDLTINYNKMTVGNPDASTGSFTPIQLGESFKLKEVLPKEQKVGELLRSFLKALNMYAIENPNNDKEIIIEPYDVFYAQADSPREFALDWSKKIDQDSLHMKINTQLPKSYNFKFKEDTDYYNTLYKNTYNAIYGNFSINNKNGSVEPKPIEIIFSATVIVREDGDDKTLPSIYTGDISNKKPYKSNLRLLYNNGVDFCDDYAIVETLSPTTYNVLVGGVDTYQKSHHVLTVEGSNIFNLLFGLPLAIYYPADGEIFNIPTIYDELYQRQLQELNSENIFTLEADANLTEIDIAKLDLRKPIFIATEQGAAYFKIINVTYYGAQEVSKVVLQKIIL